MRRRKPWKIGEGKILGKESVSAGVLSLVYSGKQEGYESGREYTKMEQGGVQKSDPVEPYVLVQSLTHIRLFVTLWTAAHQVPLPFTISQSLLSFMSIEPVMLSSHLILCCPLLLLLSVFPSIRVFSHKSALHIRWPKYGASASASVLSMNIQGWYALGLIGLIPLLSKGLSRVFSSTTTQKY